MKDELIKRIAALLEVKSIITLVVIAGVTWGFANKLVPGEMYSAFASSIITYYFTRKNVQQ